MSKPQRKDDGQLLLYYEDGARSSRLLLGRGGCAAAGAGASRGSQAGIHLVGVQQAEYSYRFTRWLVKMRRSAWLRPITSRVVVREGLAGLWHLRMQAPPLLRYSLRECIIHLHARHHLAACQKFRTAKQALHSASAQHACRGQLTMPQPACMRGRWWASCAPAMSAWTGGCCAGARSQLNMNTFCSVLTSPLGRQLPPASRLQQAAVSVDLGLQL